MTGADEVSEESRVLASRVRERAAELPDACEVVALTAQAMSQSGGAMPAEDIRRLAAEALQQARQVSALLSQLASLMEDPAP